MDLKKSKDIMRKHKKPRPPSTSDSSSSSDSDSGSSSDSFSSSSSSKKPVKRKIKKIRPNRRSSSSSDNGRLRKREKHACHKKLEAKKSHLKRKLKEAKAKKRILSPGMRRRSITPTQKIKKMIISVDKKHHGLSAKERIREKERERERERLREREKDREREKEKLRVRERIRSRSPKSIKLRSPKLRGRDLKRKSPLEKHHMSPREKLICQIRRDRSPVDRKKELRRRLDESRERERRERERAEREAARNKEREEALARCQERQRERERLAREKLRREKEKEYKTDRLLPRPAEREMAIAAARASSREKSVEREIHPHRSHPHSHTRTPREPVYERGYEREREYIPHDHRIEKEDRRELDREYLVLRCREIESPPPAVGHYVDRVRNEREIYPEDQKYEREHTYISRNYMSPPPEPHRREPNWERDHEHPREREIDHGKVYSNERPSTSSRDWPIEEDWHLSQKDQWKENWPKGEPVEENWSGEEKFRSHQTHEWEDSRMKHDTHREDHHSSQTHTSRRWPQEWRGRPNEERPGHQAQMPTNFRHSNSVAHPIEYQHERPEPIYRRQHPPPPQPLMQQHIPHPGSYHVRPHFPSKRQMTYINPNQNNHLANQSTTHNLLKPVTAPAPQAVLTSQTHSTNQIAPTNNSSIVEKSVSESLEEKSKEKQEQHLESKDSTVEKNKDIESQQPVSSEEPIRDDLSEISDDADEILNKDEEVNKVKNEENWDSESNGAAEENPKKEEEVNVTSNENNEIKLEQVLPDATENKEETQIISEEQIKTDPENKDVNDDILDFEEISDGELEEDARTKNLGDALGVDWASLVEESKFRQAPVEKDTTAKQRWQPHRIILDVGISLKYAGEEFAKKLFENARNRKLNEEKDSKNIESKIEIKEEVSAENEFDLKVVIPEIKSEVKEEECDSKPLLDPLACVQVAKYKQEESKRNLVFTACGQSSRALSARKDLKLRRQLCGLPIKEIGFQRPVSNHLKNLALKAFQKTLAEVK